MTKCQICKDTILDIEICDCLDHTDGEKTETVCIHCCDQEYW